MVPLSRDFWVSIVHTDIGLLGRSKYCRHGSPCSSERWWKTFSLTAKMQQGYNICDILVTNGQFVQTVHTLCLPHSSAEGGKLCKCPLVFSQDNRSELQGNWIRVLKDLWQKPDSDWNLLLILVMSLCQTISVQGQLHLFSVPRVQVDIETGNWDSSSCGTRNSFFIYFCACAMTECGNLSCIVVTECKSSKGVLWSQAECWEVLTASDGNCMWYVTALPPHLQIQKYSAGYLLKLFSHPKIVVNKCY